MKLFIDHFTKMENYIRVLEEKVAELTGVDIIKVNANVNEADITNRSHFIENIIVQKKAEVWSCFFILTIYYGNPLSRF